MMNTENETFLAKYRELSCLIGRTVGVVRVPAGKNGAENMEGEVLGFSGEGALILATARGNIELASGEVTLRPAGGTQA
jgi:biotin-(acetyl-CoA carboxylase) ligase